MNKERDFFSRDNVSWFIISLIISIILIYIGLRWDFYFYEHNLNFTNPLILDYDFVLCQMEEHSNYYIQAKNLNGKEIDLDKTMQ